MITKFKKIIITLLITIAGLAAASFTMAQVPDLGLNYGAALNLPTADPRLAAVHLIKLALTFVGIIAVIIILYGGYLWMTSAGDAQKIDKAKKVLISAIIGLIIILSAFLIVDFVGKKITSALGGGGCTPALTRACGCGGMGTETCQADRTWGPCIGGSCFLPNICCPGGHCAADCSLSSFMVNSTSPASGMINIPMNAKVRFRFSDNVNAATVNNTTFTVTGAGGPIAGTRTVNGRRIEFAPPAGTCPVNVCGANECFTAGDNITVTAVNGAGGILSAGGMTLTCGIVNPCTINFTVGSTVDCQNPSVALDFDQICVAPNNNIYAFSSDDSGIDSIEFFVNGTSIPNSPPGNNPIINPAANSPFNTRSEMMPSIWDGSGYSPGSTVQLRATAYDLDAHSASANRNITLRAAHCCNGEFDDTGDPDLLGGPPETGADCGGECAGCAGAACGTSMADDCTSVPGINCHDNDDRCASRFCDCGGDAAACTAAGYGASVSNCCLCENAPIIDWVSPQGGFCRDAGGTPTNTVCRNDMDCTGIIPGPGTCDNSTANGMPGNLVTIGGRYFGTPAGTVDFSGVGAALAETVNPACTPSWTNNQIIVVMPAGVPANPVVTVTAAGGLSDATDNTRGPNIPFVVNTINRPGLCLLTPDHGQMGANISYNGINILNNTAYFGNAASYAAALNPVFPSAIAGTAQVPNIRTGRTTSFTLNPAGNVGSNYLFFTKDAEAPAGPRITSFSPLQGPISQYVTIFGSGFGASRGASQVFFGDEITGTEADYDFPAVCASSVWRDNQVIVKVPDMGGGNLDIPITMVLSAATIDTTGLATPNFGYRPGSPLTPSLCRIQPVMGPNSSPISLWGEYFGAGPGAVRFHLNHNQLAANITYWGPDGDAQRIDTTVHPLAVTGPVQVVQGVAGNGLNFRVGSCASDADCGGTTCCPSSSYMAGQCASDSDSDGDIDIDDCYIAGASSVFEWDFSTGAGAGTIGQPCYDGNPMGSCNPLNPPCSGNLVCDPASGCTCQLPCDNDGGGSPETCDIPTGPCPSGWSCDPTSCFCVADSCQARSSYVGSCDPYFCPNTPGQCSYNAGTTATVASCDNSVCNGLGACGVSCVYNATLDKCVNPTFGACDLAISDVTGVTGNTLTRYCAGYGGSPRWLVNTTTSCPDSPPNTNSWTMTTGSRCVENGTTCALCPAGYSCLDDGSGTGVCAVANDICPGASVCNTVTGDCEVGTRAQCECCCEIGQDARDCCAPLTCGWMCGDDTNPTDGAGFGLCSGCALASDPDAACNCVGHTNQYCDTTTGPDADGDGSPDGVCRDCTYLGSNPGECALHATCCTDAMNGNNCRGGDGTILAGGTCPYYNCAPAAPFNCDTTAVTSGTYRDVGTCNTNCGTSPFGPMGGKSCFDPTAGTCSLTCASPYLCLGDTGCLDMNPTPPPPACTAGDTSCLCCCDTSASPDPCTTLGLSGLNCQEAEPCENGNRGLCCGCSKDTDCVVPPGIPATVGCSSDTCCRNRPGVLSPTKPADDAANICRNTQISVTFDQLMDLSSFSGNVLVVGDYGSGSCPAGTQYLARGNKIEERGFLARIFSGLWRTIIRTLKPVLPTPLARAYTPVLNHNYCAIRASVSGENDEAASQGTLTVAPNRLLDGNRLYYVIVKGDDNLTDDQSQGVLSRWGVGMNGPHSETFNGINYTGAYIFSFTTLPEQARNNGVCDFDHVEIIPSSYLFQTTVNDSFEVDTNALHPTFDTARDSDKLFIARAKAANGQTLSPIPGAYDWSWNLNSSNPVIVDSVGGITGLTANKALMRTGVDVLGGRASIIAAATITANTYSPTPAVGTVISDSADVYIMLCDNPWPPVSVGPLPPAGTWYPWRDDTEGMPMAGCIGGPCVNTNYEIYYCRDAGRTGTYDDLPAVLSDSTVIRGQAASGEIVKEAYFFREALPATAASLIAANNALAEDGGSVNLTWAAAGADGYKIYWGRSSGSYPNSLDVGSVTAYTLDSLTNNQVYYFNITSYFNTGAESAYWGEASTTPRDVNPPAIPAGFAATAGDGKVELSWIASAGASSYKVFYGSTGGPGFGYSSNIGNGTDIILSGTGLTNGNLYDFGVLALDSAGNPSATATLAAIQPFAAPTGLRVDNASTTYIDLAWNLNGDGVGITVEWGTTSGSYGPPAALGGTDTSYRVSGLIPDTVYYFLVTSSNGVETQSSGEISGRTLKP